MIRRNGKAKVENAKRRRGMESPPRSDSESFVCQGYPRSVMSEFSLSLCTKQVVMVSGNACPDGAEFKSCLITSVQQKTVFWVIS